MKQRILEIIKKREIDIETLSNLVESPIDEVNDLLAELMNEGLVYLNSRKKYCLVRPWHIIDTLRTQAKGIKYILDGKDKIIIPNNQVHTALKHDVIVVERTFDNFGKVVGILKRENRKLVCEVKERRNQLYLVPFNENCELTITCDKTLLKDYIIGDRVYIELDDYSLDDDNNVVAHNVTKIGHFNDRFNDEIAIAITKGFEIEFSEDAMIEADQIPDVVTDEDMVGRLDLTNEQIFTIDSIKTKDMDDAISIKKLSNGNFLLGVHIADVSYYIKPNSKLFEEASKRATSVYIGNVVIPMIPSKLSNGICSLNEGVRRLTKSCIIEINPRGKVVNHKIVDSVICSGKKMTYEELNEMFRTGVVTDSSYMAFMGSLELARELSNILSKTRRSLDFESSDISIDKPDDNTTEFNLRDNDEAERIIENFMIMANEVVATHFRWRDIPFIYRVHNDPDELKLSNAMDLIQNLGYKLVRIQNAYGQRAIQNILNEFKGTPEFSIISNLLLRNMAKAKYSTENIGHFALAIDNYCHFTSPIRRFPDLMVHTLINYFINNPDRYVNLKRLEEELDKICEHSSYKERQADDAERDYIKLKMAEYMANHIGEEFTGIILDIDKESVFIKLDNNIRGVLDDMSLMNSAFEIDYQKRELICKHSKQKIKLGDNLVLKVTRVNIPQKEIYFEIRDIIKKGKCRQLKNPNN